jgi:hypothetical protein
MNFDLSIIISLLAFIISFAGLLISFFSFKRNRRFDNENYLYKTKTDKYHEVLIQISSILRKIDKGLDLAHECNYVGTDDSKDELADVAEKLDDDLNKFYLTVSALTLLFPSDIIKLIDSLFELLLELNIESNDLDKEEIKSGLCYDKSEEIQTAMRTDLDIETLNVRLYKRIKSS